MLDPLDKELTNRGHRFARYADDLIIMVSSVRAGKRVLGSVTRFIEHDLKLKVNIDRSQVVKCSKCKFLGFSVYGENSSGGIPVVLRGSNAVCVS